VVEQVVDRLFRQQTVSLVVQEAVEQVVVLLVQQERVEQEQPGKELLVALGMAQDKLVEVVVPGAGLELLVLMV
jgi:hypothetical protein